MTDTHIERLVTIGILTSDEFTKQIRAEIKVELFQAQVAQTLLLWGLEYFDKYGKTAKSNIETIYFKKLKTGTIPKDVAEEIEEDILPDLSEQYLNEGLNVEYLLCECRKYLTERKINVLRDTLEVLIDKGKVTEAENLIADFKTTVTIADEVILNQRDSLPMIREALNTTYEPVIQYSGALGQFWNNQMVRGGFVAYLSPEKRGKSMLLMDAALRGVRQKRNVAFFQAGDMTRNQMLRRIVINITGKPDKDKYTGDQYLPVKDCVNNQLNLCDKNIRECRYGVFEDRGWSAKQLREDVTMEDLIEAYKDEPDYQPCYNCSTYYKERLGAVWLEKKKLNLIAEKEVIKKSREFFIRKQRNLRISTHPNNTLSVENIKQILDSWEIRDNWKADIIIIDYADLLIPSRNTEFRHQQNQIWKDLRGLGQARDVLLLTATQSDAKSYDQNTLKLSNFSEDKRKYAHVTAIYGLNQDKTGREKKLGILRINELILREDEFDSEKHVYILQALKIARPVVASFF